MALSAVVYAFGRFYDAGGLRVVSVVLAVAGLFTLFEANRSWCVVRALGFKTRI